MSVTTPTYGVKNPVTCVTGRSTTTSTKILVASLFSTAVTVTVNGVNYVSGVDFTMTARGTNICWTGVIEITTGLSAYTRYTWSATDGTRSDNGSFFVEPTSTTSPFQFDFAGCDSNTVFSNSTTPFVNNVRPWTVPGSWQYIKTRAQAANPPHAGVLFVDDIGYVDLIRVADNGSSYSYGGESGLITSSARPADSGALDDYLIGWCALLGMLGPTQSSGFSSADLEEDGNLLMVLWAREENRSWCRKNLNMWTQWGDHELADDFGWDVNSTTSSLYSDIWTNGKTAWEAFYGLIKPPIISGTLPASFNNSTGVKRDTSAKHWAFKIGNIVIATLDGITNAARASWASAALPVANTRKYSNELTQFTAIYGSNQIDDVLEAIDYLAGTHTVLGLAHGIRYLVQRDDPASVPPKAFTSGGSGENATEYNTGAQHPLYDHCLTDYQRLFTSTAGTAGGFPPASLMHNPKTNGTTGNLVCVHGDYHHGLVTRNIHAAYTGNAVENFYSVYHATTNRSAYFDQKSNNNDHLTFDATDGTTISDCLIEYNSTVSSYTETTGTFHATQLKTSEDGKWLTIRFSEREDDVLWEKKFMRIAYNYAFPSTWDVKVSSWKKNK